MRNEQPMYVLDHSILHGDTAYGQSELDGSISLHLKLDTALFLGLFHQKFMGYCIGTHICN